MLIGLARVLGSALCALSVIASPLGAEQTVLGVPDNEQLEAGEVRAWRFNVSTPQERTELLRVAQKLDADIWSVAPGHVDMRLTNSNPETLSSLLPSYSSDYSPISVFVAASPPAPAAWLNNYPTAVPWDLRHLSSDFHSEYHRFEEIVAFANELSRLFPNTVELVRIGQSVEGREILGIKIEEPGSGRKIRPRIVIEGAQHARDWVAISAALYFAHSLVVPASDKGSYTELLENYSVTIIPVPNPDGYVYTWDEDRLWYKNRLPEPTAQCTGIDMNRNWGFHWDASGDPCHHWYGGARPFEAPEVSAIASYLTRTPNIHMFIDLRSYGQMLMYPYSYSCDDIPAGAEDLIEAALGAARANKAIHGMNVFTGSACELLYPSPGNVIDWAYAEAGIAFAYSVFLRDTGAYGFLLPPTYIRPVGEENSALMHYLAHWLTKNKF